MKRLVAAARVLRALVAVASAGTPVLAQTDTSARVITYLTLTPVISVEDSAAIAWGSTLGGYRVRHVSLEGRMPDFTRIPLLWIHIPDSATYAAWTPHLAAFTPLRGWFVSGGRFLFTGLAAGIVAAAGIEPQAPAIEALDIEDDWLFDQKGFQGYRPDIDSDSGSHPIFRGLFGGAFTYDAAGNHRAWSAGWFGTNIPAAGMVAAVEKSYITISADRRLVVEYNTPRARGMVVGGFIRFAMVNHRRSAMERFMENAVRYVAGESAPGRPSYWHASDLKPVLIEYPAVLAESLRAGARYLRGMGTAFFPDPSKEIVITRDSATSNFYDVAGRRALLMGAEKGGIDEVWTHPFRLLRDYRAGIVSGDSIVWLDDVKARIEIRPESFTRSYALPQGTLTEIVFAPRQEPAGVVHYQFRGEGGLDLAVKFRSDLRLMWPYDAPSGGAIYFATDTATGTILFTDGPGASAGAMGADAKPIRFISGHFDSVWLAGGNFMPRLTDANQVYHAAMYRLDGRSRPSLTVAMTGASVPPAAGTASAPDSAVASMLRILGDPAGALGEVLAHYERLLGSMTTIESPDREFNDLYKWALVGADRCLATTPGVGTGLLAGFSTTARGWDGAQKISGRPGYAWYFGRDSEWSGFAADDYGDFDLVRAQLEFLQKYQDASGKIFHEISTSGSVHYDASDATPLFIVLAGHYLRASGDTAYIRASWPRIVMALRYLYATDTDGDLLIENTNEGHGWVEGGKLYPVHTEFYLAGAWARALVEAASMAQTLGMEQDALRYRRDVEKVREILNRDFWNDSTGFFNVGKLADGSYNPEPTVLPAVVVYFGLLDDDKARRVLEQYAGAGFTSDWGVRIVSASSPLFNPQGYHYGSVWPLFTGWTALAEYEYGRPVQGFTHILNNLYIKNYWALGFVEEVMNGAVYQPSGVCPHQCWSETNILHPAITGMVGWKPDAPAHTARLAPRFPVHWEEVSVKNLRVGSSSVRFSMSRPQAGPNPAGFTRTAYAFELTSGDRVTLEFAPEMPEGMTITRVLLDGREIGTKDGRRRGLLDPAITIELSRERGGRADLILEHSGGIAVVPAMPRPEPGDSSTGHRIISTSLMGDTYEVVVEGRPGSIAEVEVRTFDGSIGRVENAVAQEDPPPGRCVLDVRFPKGDAGYVRSTIRLSLRK